MTEQEQKIMEQALNNHLVVKNILKNLTYPDLKSCRQVTHLWMRTSSSLISSQDYCQIRLFYDDTNKTFRHYPRIHRQWGTTPSGKIEDNEKLSSLNKIIQKNPIFHCTTFSIYGGQLDDPTLQQFFEIQGPQIKSLKLDHCEVDESSSKNTFQKILLEQATSIQDLKLVGIDLHHLKFQSFELPNLKKLSWDESSSRIASLIMRRSPNLNLINEFNYDANSLFNLPLIIHSNRCNLIKNFLCNPSVLTDLETLAKFISSQPPPQLEQLTLTRINENETNNYQQVISNLLTFSQQHLQVLNLSKEFGQLDIQIPRLENLKTVKMGLEDDTNQFQIMFPPLINLNYTFPNLTTLDFTCFKINFPWEESFPGTAFIENLSSVRILEINDQISDIYMEKLYKVLCPNFNILKIHSKPRMTCHGDENVNLESMLPNVFRIYQHLKSLEIIVKSRRYQYFCLDSAFTGMSSLNCDRLRHNYNQDDAKELNFEGLQIQPAVVNLKGLESIKISLESSSYYLLDKVTIKKLPLTWISSTYGFQLVPNLKVVIEYDQGCLDYEGSEGLKSQFDAMASTPQINLSHRKFYLRDI